jgi:acyl-[acyl-carrier-protein]-phospholipid O-acyltransferase/long-chain-fatty-acid--[acyl-carrier-protein] ligase
MTFFLTRRFFPLFLTQFLGALNDNLLKNAMIILITYRLASVAGQAQFLVTLAAGLFILPFFLFSATAGQLADKYPRHLITRVIKLVEIGLMILAAAGFALNSHIFLLIVLFGMGMHSTFFGPIKYALLPQHLAEDELLAGNAAVEAGTFLAILIGTILGGVLILNAQGALITSIALILFAVAGYGASRQIPVAIAPDPTLIINRNIFQETCRLIAYTRTKSRVFMCIMAISWFWFVGMTFLAQFPTYAKDVLHADAEIVTLFLTIFSLGIGVGSFLCSKLLHGQLQSTYVPLAALGMTLFGIDLSYTSMHAMVPQDHLMSLAEFLSHGANLRILFDLLLLAACGGLYIVPLYAIMQHDSDAQYRARVIASNNIINALFMVGSALFSMAAFAGGWTVPQIFLATSILNGLAAAAIYADSRLRNR